ncbi:MAG: DUF1573 domain-containing protein [Phycisphaerales bacterium]|nr:DUF1573 domain-containing protein [Phycisphaerales bacterium]
MHRRTRRQLIGAALTASLLALPSSLLAQDKAAHPQPVQPKQVSPEELAKLKAQQPVVHQQPAVAGQALPNALNIENGTFDFGDISDAEPVNHTFNFTNVSDRTVKITVAASCGCTVAGLEKDTYAPGEKGKVTATFNPQGRNGSQTKVLTMTVIDPQGVFAQQTMTITSNVKALVTVEPPKMYLTEVDHKAGQTSKLTIKARSGDFRISTAEANSEFVKINLGEPKPIEEGGEKMTQYDVELQVGKGAPIGSLSGQITFNSNDAKMKVPAYFIGADVIGDMKATPPQAMLRVTTVGTPFSTQVRIDSRSGSAFNITSIDVEGRQDMKLVADAVKNADGGYYMLTIAGQTPDQPGIVNGTIVISTDAQGGETIRVPFTAAVRKADAMPTAGKPMVQPVPGSASPAKPTIIKH